LFIFTSSCDDTLVFDTNQTQSDFKYKSVPLDEALALFQNGNSIVYKSKNKLNLKPDLSSVSQEAIKNTNEFVTLIPATTKHNNIDTKIMLIKYNDSIVKVLINMISAKEVKTDRFTGILSITKLDGKFINGYRIQNGVFISQFIKREKEYASSILYRSDPEVASDCSESLNPNSIFCHPTLDEVELVASSNTSKPPSLSVWLPSENPMSWYSPTPSDLNNGGGYSSGPSGGEEVFPCDDPLHGCDRVHGEGVFNELTNPCAKGVFGAINNEKEISSFVINEKFGSNLTFSGEILELFDKSKYNNYIINNNSIVGKNARTITDRGSVITTISDSYLGKATKLSIARTMIHELAHAYILYKFGKGNDLNFNQSVKLYAEEKGYKPNGTNEEKMRFHHEFMGEYVNVMAASLYLWDKNYNITGGDLGWEYYHAMAFGGLYYKDSDGNLIETDSFKELIPKQTEREIIKSILYNEQEGNSDAKGKKCN